MLPVAVVDVLGPPLFQSPEIRKLLHSDDFIDPRNVGGPLAERVRLFHVRPQVYCLDYCYMSQK